MQKNYPKFITFEGIDGVGKSTQAELLGKYLNNKGINTVKTREPGGTPNAENIRNLILQNNFEALTEVLLFQAARVEHINNLIKPSISEGKIVISDRYIDSTIVYQGLNGVAMDEILNIHKITTDNFFPDLTFLLIADISETISRIDARPQNKNRFDKMTKEDFLLIQEKFLHLATIFKERIVVINANLSAEYTHQQIVNYLENGILLDSF
ncbi:MAG: dTMP kinase [Sphingobacteriia bacterium]|nr:dTMP kinase [Sphingobacteriia bacterium]